MEITRSLVYIHILKLQKENKKMKNVLKTLKKDAEMALNGKWNKSDEGFEDQITLIKTVIN